MKTTPIPVKFDRQGHSCNFYGGLGPTATKIWSCACGKPGSEMGTCHACVFSFCCVASAPYFARSFLGDLFVFLSFSLCGVLSAFLLVSLSFCSRSAFSCGVGLGCRFLSDSVRETSCQTQRDARRILRRVAQTTASATPAAAQRPAQAHNEGESRIMELSTSR